MRAPKRQDLLRASGALLLWLALGVLVPSAAESGDDSHLPPPVVRKITKNGRRVVVTPPAPPPRRPVPVRPTPPAPTPTRPPTPPSNPPPLPQPGTLLPPNVRVVDPGAPTIPPPRRGARGSGEIQTPSLPPILDGEIGQGLPSRPPPKPRTRREPEPGDVGFRVARPGGALRVFRDESNPESRQLVIVMVGNPRIWRPAHTDVDEHGRPREVEALSVKANCMVAWVDGAEFPATRSVCAVARRDVELPLGEQDRVPGPVELPHQWRRLSCPLDERFALPQSAARLRHVAQSRGRDEARLNRRFRGNAVVAGSLGRGDRRIELRQRLGIVAAVTGVPGHRVGDLRA